MAEFIKLQTLELPRLHVVGRAYVINMEAHMKDNKMGSYWDECFAGGVFGALEAQAEYVYDDAYVGWMADWQKGDGNFVYIIGMLMKDGFTLPDGYADRVIGPETVGVGWIRGADAADVCSSAHEWTDKALQAEGYRTDGAAWCMEYYGCPRFTTPDENGLIILDYYLPCVKA